MWKFMISLAYEPCTPFSHRPARRQPRSIERLKAMQAIPATPPAMNISKPYITSSNIAGFIGVYNVFTYQAVDILVLLEAFAFAHELLCAHVHDTRDQKHVAVSYPRAHSPDDIRDACYNRPSP